MQVYTFNRGTYFEFGAAEPAGNITSVTFEYESGGGYFFDRSYKLETEDTNDGIKYKVTDKAGAKAVRFSINGGTVYLSKVIVEYIGVAPDDGTTTIDKLISGKKDVAGAKIKFTNAQVVYKEDNGGTYNYIVREGGKALDLMGTALNFDLGASLNGTVTMDVTYNSGILKATDAAETSDADLTKSGSSDKYLPVTTTLANISNNAGDLVYLEKVSLYHDTYNDLGGGTDAYYLNTGYKYALISNYAEVADKLADAAGTYLVTAWYNAAGTGMVAASLKVIDAQMPLSAPVITAAEESFLESTTVTITATDGATIYYTLDNSTPQSARGTTYTYTVPFTINQTTTVKAVAVKDGVTSDVTEKTFTGPSTIADLYNNAQSQTNVLLKLTDAKVVYADGNGNYILRENGKALDVLNTSLDLKQGTVLNGTVQLNVNYTYGIISTSDIDGTTNADKLTVTGEESTEPDPIVCTTLSEIKNYPGDLIKKDNMLTYGSYAEAYESGSWNYVYFLNSSDFGISSGKTYDILGWYSSVYYSNPRLKIVQADPVITSLSAPTIDGTTPFTDNTTVTITSSESVASIYYTTNGDEPTISSMKYDGSFTLTETATVKAIAVYKNIVSSVTTKEFTKVDPYVAHTISELAQLKLNFEATTVKLEDALVVYGDGSGNFILRDKDNKALDVLNTSLPLTVGATVSGTVMVKINFAANEWHSNGVLSTTDIEQTNAENLTIVEGKTTLPSPLTVNLVDAPNYPGDLLEVSNVQGWVSYGSYSFWTSGSEDIYLSNGADYGVISNNAYNALIWYNDAKDNNCWSKIVGLKQTLDYTITSAGWGTIILPFSTEKPAGMDVYECTGVQKNAETGVGTLQVKEASCLMANTPYLVKGTEGVEMPFSLEGYAAKQTQEQYSNGVMTGVFSELAAPTGVYVLQNQPDVDGLAFYRVLESQPITLTPYRCYINAQNDQSLRAIRFPGTDANSIYGATAANGLVDVFTTTGVKVKNQVERAHALDGLAAGVYIINNQKVIKK